MARGNDSPESCGKPDCCLGWKGVMQIWGTGKGGHVDAESPTLELFNRPVDVVLRDTF